jgi:hypothetical protein
MDNGQRKMDNARTTRQHYPFFIDHYPLKNPTSRKQQPAFRGLPLL